MSLKIYNTHSKKLTSFESIEKNKVKMYCCGPTVYGLLHVGNFRGPVFYNFLRNWLEKSGYDVTYVYNFTDIDDKIIQRANEDHVEPRVLAEKYIKEFWTDFNNLKLKPHTLNPKVTETLDYIIEYISKLIEKGHAYASNGDVYFEVKSLKQYGDLSNKNTDELESSGRVDTNPNKNNPLDFALWKSAKEGEESWDSPWGMGRPGWHIECSAMIEKHLGAPIDIHGGGLDLLFPHHENEKAQGEGYCTHEYVKYWVHNNMLTFDGSKMSKSSGNIISMREFLDQYPGEVFKFLILNGHYRSTLDYGLENINLAIKGLLRIYSALERIETILSKSKEPVETINFKEFVQKKDEEMTNAANEDFNTAKLNSHIFELVREFNAQVPPFSKITGESTYKAQLVKNSILSWGELLALYNEPPKEFIAKIQKIFIENQNIKESWIQEKLANRTEAKKNKDYSTADSIRDELLNKGIEIQDTPTGAIWKIIVK